MRILAEAKSQHVWDYMGMQEQLDIVFERHCSAIESARPATLVPETTIIPPRATQSGFGTFASNAQSTVSGPTPGTAIAAASLPLDDEARD